MDSRDVARGLAWFGIGLGLAELLAPRTLARAAGLEGHERLLQGFGLREVASGVAILSADDPEAWLWTRVLGDGLDGLLLGRGMMPDNPGRERAMLAAAVVAPVVALDLLYARKGGGDHLLPDPLPQTWAVPDQSRYVRYDADVETVTPDENETLDAILASMHRLQGRTRAKYNQAVRVSHAKAHGAAVGEMTVYDDLPSWLAQGVFRPGARYPAIVRLAKVPGELDRDAVATQRGLSIKLLDVEGTPLAGHDGRTQDFVLDSGDRFAAGNAKQFLMNHRMLEHAPQVPDDVKAAVSAASRALNKGLHAMGSDSAMLDFFGHSRVHPLAEAYFSQAPLRFGDYLCKLAAVPIAPAQQGLAGTPVDPRDPDRLRTATVDYLREHDAEFEIRVQLCTDLETMPVEDASKEWPERESPYQPVARVRLSRQEAFSPARRDYVDGLSFCVSHSLEAHRPLGSIMRARLRAYPVMSRARRQANGVALREPASLDEVPA